MGLTLLNDDLGGRHRARGQGQSSRQTNVEAATAFCAVELAVDTQGVNTERNLVEFESLRAAGGFPGAPAKAPPIVTSTATGCTGSGMFRTTSCGGFSGSWPPPHPVRPKTAASGDPANTRFESSMKSPLIKWKAPSAFFEVQYRYRTRSVLPGRVIYLQSWLAPN